MGNPEMSNINLGMAVSRESTDSRVARQNQRWATNATNSPRARIFWNLGNCLDLDTYVGHMTPEFTILALLALMELLLFKWSLVVTVMGKCLLMASSVSSPLGQAVQNLEMAE